MREWAPGPRVLAVVALLVAGGAGAAEVPDELLDRAGARVEESLTRLNGLVATESYLQERFLRVRSPIEGGSYQPQVPSLEWEREERVQRRVTRARFLVLRQPDGRWLALRDVYQVGGRTVGPAVDHLAALMGAKAGDGGWDPSGLSRVSASYNLGKVERTVNVPVLALLVLARENRARFRFEAGGDERVEGMRTTRVRFVETTGPTLIHDLAGGELPAVGTLWVEPRTGQVLRSELSARPGPARVSWRIEVRYRRDRGLDLWVPREMREEYGPGDGSPGEALHCRATYAGWRRFAVESGIRLGDAAGR